MYSSPYANFALMYNAGQKSPPGDKATYTHVLHAILVHFTKYIVPSRWEDIEPKNQLAISNGLQLTRKCTPVVQDSHLRFTPRSA